MKIFKIDKVLYFTEADVKKWKCYRLIYLHFLFLSEIIVSNIFPFDQNASPLFVRDWKGATYMVSKERITKENLYIIIMMLATFCILFSFSSFICLSFFSSYFSFFQPLSFFLSVCKSSLIFQTLIFIFQFLHLLPIFFLLQISAGCFSLCASFVRSHFL